ncbi:MAG: hypothetical protein ACK5JU_03545 [Bacteroidales bacterium]
MSAENDKLSKLCDLFQDLTSTPTKEQLYDIYGKYLADFVSNPFEMDGMKITVNKQKVNAGKIYDNFLSGKHETFCHIVSRGVDKSKKRNFDPKRANKIHWIKPILENRDNKKIRYFEELNSTGQWCRFYWYKEKKLYCDTKRDKM